MTIGVHDTTETVYFFIPRKDGAPGKRVGMRFDWCTKTHACESCGRIGSPRYVQERSDCWMGDWRDIRHMRFSDFWLTLPVCQWLCMGCWNRVRPFFYRLHELAELRTLARRLRYAKQHG